MIRANRGSGADFGEDSGHPRTSRERLTNSGCTSITRAAATWFAFHPEA